MGRKNLFLTLTWEVKKHSNRKATNRLLFRATDLQSSDLTYDRVRPGMNEGTSKLRTEACNKALFKKTHRVFSQLYRYVRYFRAEDNTHVPKTIPVLKIFWCCRDHLKASDGSTTHEHFHRLVNIYLYHRTLKLPTTLFRVYVRWSRCL